MMRRSFRRLVKPGPSEQFVLCPICQKSAKVGGGKDLGHWVIQPHGRPEKLCSGTGQHLALETVTFDRLL
jgi:hypothetical protein